MAAHSKKLTVARSSFSLGKRRKNQLLARYSSCYMRLNIGLKQIPSIPDSPLLLYHKFWLSSLLDWFLDYITVWAAFLELKQFTKEPFHEKEECRGRLSIPWLVVSW